MNVTPPATRPQCDRVAYYVAPNDDRVTIPVVAGREPDETIERHGRTYRRVIVATPQGDGADTVIDRAILAAVRAAEEAGETDDLVREALEELAQIEDAA
jgi:hypothetical protein